MTTLKARANPADHLIGNLNSQVVLVEYGDFECSHSTKAYNWIEKIMKEYRGDLCYVFRHFPLMDIHPHSAMAAMATEVAHLEGKFWEMHKLLFTHNRSLSSEDIIKMAGHLNIHEEKFLDGLDREELMDKVCQDIITGEEGGVTSTPAFFINNIKMEGPISFELLKQNISKALHGQSLSA